MIRNLSKKEVPDGSLMLFVSDVHIGIEHTTALRLMVEACEALGVTHVIAGGDILDMHCISEHPKDPDRILAAGTLLEEVESGRWLLNWFATRPCVFIQGNHEGRLDRFIAKHAPALYGTAAGSLKALAQLPSGIEVLPWVDGTSEVRLGNLSMCHLDGEFKRGTGGKNPAQRVLEMLPDQSTMGGHVHRISQARRTSKDEHGVPRTRAAWTSGHMSHEHKHHAYAGKVPNWQMGFILIRVFWERSATQGDRPRFFPEPVEIHFDRRNKPYFCVYGRMFR